MEIKREIETRNAKYTLSNLTEEQFRFIAKSIERYLFCIHRCLPDEESELGQLRHKINLMLDSEIVIIK